MATSTLILGGSRSGKSAFAEQLLASAEDVFYLATATAVDDEMTQRILQHQQQRPGHWTVLEVPLLLTETLQSLSGQHATVLVDCLTLWLNNQLYRSPEQDFRQLRQRLADAVTSFDGRLVLVSNEVGAGVIPLGPINRRFVDEQGWLNQQLAACCDQVVLVCAGLPLYLKGQPDAAN
ncbi:bifunctional adenosylcobinamide kinase/adenosylcobinamide-phosphate guanylyltransferase [Rheinheimera marina]|uniref:Bifunctional adenosylcobalamin biosynthesis protein n=1 Tax=Rheinheimera marina TaxID=1774958 RepID=A0ABV9JK62_9GAMM